MTIHEAAELMTEDQMQAILPILEELAAGNESQAMAQAETMPKDALSAFILLVETWIEMGAAQPNRAELARMLAELSDDALRYVRRPILYARYRTDGRDLEGLSMDDTDRELLIEMAADGSEHQVKLLATCGRRLNDQTRRQYQLT